MAPALRLAVVSALVALALGARTPKRELKVEVGSREVKVTSSSQDATLKDQFDLNIKAEDDGIKCDFDYKFANRTGDTKTKTSVKYNWRVFEVIEFVPDSTVEGDAAMAFKEANTRLSKFPAEKGKWEWKDVVQSQDGAAKVFTFSDTSGVLEVVAKVTGELTSSLSPQNVKFDVRVPNYTYTRPGNSTLALRTRVQSETKIKERVSLRNDVGQDVAALPVEFDDKGARGEFTWVETYKSGTSGSKKVLVSQASDSKDNDKGVYFTFATLGNQSVNWDPTIGVATDAGHASNTGAALLLATLLAALHM
jgi:hypothetical protein